MAARLPTMRDVAQMAGVSVQTVSHVVNQTGNISEGTRQRVAKVIDALHYRPNPIARSMRTQATRLIGLLVLDLTSPVLSTIASEIETAAYAQDYKVLLYNARHNARLERESLKAFAEHLVDGLIVVNALDRQHTLTWLEEGPLPTVFIDCLPTTSYPSVAVDNVQGAYLATEHLINLGHQNIAHISGDPEFELSRRRTAGYQQALEDYGLAKFSLVSTPTGTRWDYQAGYEAMQQLLDKPERPTAVFAASDQMAIGAYRALAEAGLRVPHDVSVVGFDDIDVANFIIPPLTTVNQPLQAIATNAFNLMLEILDGSRTPDSTQLVLKPRLIVRDSTRGTT